MSNEPVRPNPRSADQIKDEIEAWERYGKSGLPSDALRAKGEEPDSFKYNLVRGAEIGCGGMLALLVTLSAISLVGVLAVT